MANGATLPIGSYNALASTTGTVQGPRIRTDVAAARRVYQHLGGIKINSFMTPVLAASMKIGPTKTVYDSVAHHNEYDQTPGFVTLDDGTGGLGAGSGYDSSDVSLICSAGQGSRVVIYDTLKNLATGEIMWVTNRVGDTLTVTRGFTGSGNSTNGGAGGVAGTAIAASQELQILAPVFPENSARPAGKSTEPLIVDTYLQISRKAVEASRRLIDSKNYGMKAGDGDVDEWVRIHDDVLDDMKRAQERSLLFNEGTTSVSSTTSGTMTNGIPARILTNRFNIAGALDEVTMENYVIALNRYNNGKLNSVINFTGDNVARTVDQFARDSVRYSEETTVLGCKVRGWKCSVGTLLFTPHGMFGPQTSSALYSAGSPVGWLLSIQFDRIKKLQFGKNGGLKYDPNAKTPGQDGEVGVWTEDWGIQLMNERQHGWMYGISGL